MQLRRKAREDFLDDSDGFVDAFAGDVECGTEADALLAATEDEKTLLKAQR